MPGGVEWLTVGELFDYEQPTKYLVKTKNYDDRFSTPVLTAGKTFLLGYTEEEDNKYLASVANPVIIFDDFTTATQWVDFDFKAKSSAMKMIKAKDSNKMTLRFLWYIIPSILIDTTDHGRHWISSYSKVKIPVPSLSVQAEIVETLDSLDALVNDISVGLPAEIRARRRQYEYYRDILLSFKELKEVA